MFLTIIHGSQEKRTSTTSAWDRDGRFEWKGLGLDLWDGENAETVEFIVTVERNGVRWRDSLATLTMGEYRRAPEQRCTVERPLMPLSKQFYSYVICPCLLSCPVIMFLHHQVHLELHAEA